MVREVNIRKKIKGRLSRYIEQTVKVNYINVKMNVHA